jgi:TolB-like protein
MIKFLPIIPFERMIIMKSISIFLSILFLASLLGCGASVQQSLKVNQEYKTNIGKNRQVVILPFADYTDADNLDSAYRRNMFINENLTDRFILNGFAVPVQEDVFRYLVNRNIINVVAYAENNSRTLQYEMNKDWSPAMKRELQRYINQARTNAPANPVFNSPGTLGLDQGEVANIGKYFAADYVVRGSIIQYKTRQDPSWAPWKKGVVSFVTGVTNQIAFGQARSDRYDELGHMVAGGTLGALYGDWDPKWPYSSTNKSILGVSGGTAGNTIAWGAIGAGLGNMAYNAGDIPQAVVQLRMWVQDAYSGQVVWTNRVDVKVSPQSVLADYQYDALFEGAIEQAVKVLMDDFMYVLDPRAQTLGREKEANMNKAARRTYQRKTVRSSSSSATSISAQTPQ